MKAERRHSQNEGEKTYSAIKIEHEGVWFILQAPMTYYYLFDGIEPAGTITPVLEKIVEVLNVHPS